MVQFKEMLHVFTALLIIGQYLISNVYCAFMHSRPEAKS